ncbi:MAG: hypothetical protein ACOC9J_00570 [Persicimonas sp.]
MSVAQQISVVISEDADPTRLPDWASLFVLVCQHLAEEFEFEELEAQARVSRRGGSYTGLDVVMFLLAYFCCAFVEGGKPKGGLRGFSRRCQPYKDQLAAICGRDRWPSSASISRFLKVVDKDCVAGFMRWSLGQNSSADDLLGDDQVVWKDGQGDGLHVIDWDPRAHMLRQRSLPKGEDRPQPRRRSDGLGAPGYPGRKRGEVRSTRGLLVHEGAAQVVASYLQKGNGAMSSGLDGIEAGLEDFWQHSLCTAQQTLVRIDGEGDVTAILNALVNLGAEVLVRISRYDLLETDEAIERLESDRWVEVPGGHSGPRREVLELGRVQLHATAVPEGRPDLGAPLGLRVIVTRFRADQKKSQSQTGLTRGAYHYEMFATSLKPHRWSAGQLVGLFFSRATVENRFNQQDKDICLQTTFCQEPHGQHLAQIVGLWVWNILLRLAWRICEPELHLPKQQPQQPSEDPDDLEVDPSEGELLEVDPSKGELSAQQTQPQPQPELSQKTIERLDNLQMVYDTHTHSLICAAETHLWSHRIRHDSGRDYHQFRAPKGACIGCTFREHCMNSTAVGYQKEVWIGVDEFGDHVVKLRPSQPLQIEPPPDENLPPMKPRRPQTRVGSWLEKLRDACLQAQVTVEVDKPTPAHPWRNPGQWHEINRSRIRYTWKMRFLHNELAPDATVEIHWRNPGPLKKLLTTDSTVH